MYFAYHPIFISTSSFFNIFCSINNTVAEYWPCISSIDIHYQLVCRTEVQLAGSCICEILMIIFYFKAGITHGYLCKEQFATRNRPTVQITFIFIGQTHLVFGKRVCTCVTKHSNAFRTFLNWLKNLNAFCMNRNCTFRVCLFSQILICDLWAFDGFSFIQTCRVHSLRNPTSPNPWHQRLTRVRAPEKHTMWLCKLLDCHWD